MIPHAAVAGPWISVLVKRIKARESVLVKAALAWSRDPCDVTEDRVLHAAQRLQQARDARTEWKRAARKYIRAMRKEQR